MIDLAEDLGNLIHLLEIVLFTGFLMKQLFLLKVKIQQIYFKKIGNIFEKARHGQTGFVINCGKIKFQQSTNYDEGVVFR